MEEGHSTPEQEVAGSNPARRANPKHFSILQDLSIAPGPQELLLRKANGPCGPGGAIGDPVRLLGPIPIKCITARRRHNSGAEGR
jgi:hypothetical protein